MNSNILELLRCPECQETLELRENNSVNNEFLLHCKICSKNFLGNENLIDFLGSKNLKFNGKWEKMIRSMYAKFYTPATNAMFLFCGGVKRAKREVLEHIEVKDNQKILETGVGAAENFYLLNKKANNLEFYGNDIQNQMLIHSVRNLKKWKIKANLYRSDAQFLPFKDESFDVVFHLGSINLFPDKKKAIDEMIRVAKPGTKIVIADESQKAEKLMSIFTGVKSDAKPPIDLIPKGMIEPRFQTIWRGYGYLIEFQKPFNKSKKSIKQENNSKVVDLNLA
ncbi:MAG: methyltransferase domain-containing protein [Flavobacteriaceae bacterium]